MRIFLLIAIVLFSTVTNAQKKNTPPYFAKTITAEELRDHLFIVASAEMEGRNTPSPGLEKAADYIEKHFREAGLKPGNGDSYRQTYPLYKDSMTVASLVVNGKSFALNNDFQPNRSEEHTSELQSREKLLCRLLLE